MNSEKPISHPTGNRSFGRRLGRPLRPNRKAALAHLETLGIPENMITKDGALDPRDLFPDFTPTEIWFELGFGQGEHLVARLAQHPEHAFIGAEPYINGMSNLLAHLPASAPKNLRVYMDDALFFLRTFQANSLDRLYVLNPDPWPKKRHHKRRIINPENLDLFDKVLKKGAQLIVSTDVQELAEWVLEQTTVHGVFGLSPASAQDPHTPPTDWPLTTKYMKKGIEAGRKPYFLVFSNRTN